MDSYLTKPFGPEQLQSLGQRVLAALPDPWAFRGREGGKMTAASPSGDDATTPTLADAIIAYLQTSTQLSAAQIEGVFPAICRSIADNLGKTIKALEEEDYDGLSLAAHTLKGTLLQCGLHTLAERAEEICRLSRGRDLPPLARLVDHLSTGLADVVVGKGRL
jgi:two-component system, sensor histidine kinase